MSKIPANIDDIKPQCKHTLTKRFLHCKTQEMKRVSLDTLIIYVDAHCGLNIFIELIDLSASN